MIKKITFFEPNDLEEMTGLTHEELWDVGFNLDDIDFGIVVEGDALDEQREEKCLDYYGNDYTRTYREAKWDNETPYYVWWLINHMGNHCVGYEYCDYNGKHWYTVHHS